MSRYLKRPHLRVDIFGVLRYYSGFGRSDDDFVDRLSRKYSVLIFSIFVLIVSSVQLVGKPITCFPPASFTTAHITYADFVCWISDKYFVPIESEIPEINDEDEQRDGTNILRFYQYVPLILICQTFGFFLPGLIWRKVSSRFGYSISRHIESLKEIRRCYEQSPAERRETIRKIAARLDQCFRSTTNSFFPRLTLIYLSIKLIYIFNIVVQLVSLNYLMNFHFDLKYLFDRFRIYSNPIENKTSQFPSNVFCDFFIRFLGKNKHRHTIQCLLPINIFNEKIFIFAYFWLIFLLICTSYNFLVHWLFFLLFDRQIVDTRQRRPRLWVSIGNNADDQRTEEITQLNRNFHSVKLDKNFSRNYLKSDGLLMMKLVDVNTDLVTINDLIDALWEFYQLEPL